MPDRWTFHENQLRLTRGGREVRLGPTAAKLLSCLLRRKGELVSHAQVLAEVWGGTDVSPDLVREYVFDLRSALGDNARRPEYLETVRGRGFRLFGDIDPASATSQTRRAKVQVMPVIVVGGDSEARARAASVVEDLVHCVSGITDVTLVGFGNGSGAGDIAPDYAVQTRISLRSDRMVARFRLVRPGSGDCVWSRRFEGPAEPWVHWDHIAAVAGNEIASWRGAVIRAEAARARMLPPEALDAYRHYVLALDFERQRDAAGAESARRHIEKSLELDPANARAWLLLWHILERPFILFGEPLSQAQWRQCKEAIARAYSLAPDDPQILANIEVVPEIGAVSYAWSVR